MEVLLPNKNTGAIIALTETPAVYDLTAYVGGYVRLASLLDADQFYICALDSITPPTVHIADTVAETGHATGEVINVADIVPGGAMGSYRFIRRAHAFLWIRAVSGTATLFLKPAGTLGEAA